MSFPASQRLIAVVALALVATYQLTRTAHDDTLPRYAAGEPPALAAALQHPSSEPLRFDPPAAGPTSTSDNPAYEACIGQPSFDGAPIDCQLLLQKPAKPRQP